jgi:Subtilase family
VRVLTCFPDGTVGGDFSWVIDGIDWVTANHQGPSVANMSLGGMVDQGVDDAVNNSIASGVTYAVAAGNGDANGNGIDACTGSPADVPNALTVGSTNESDTRSTFSNFGSCVDLFAPGENVISLFNASDTALAIGDGTSMATPHVTGSAALYLQRHPTATPADVAAGITGTATQGVVGDPQNSPNLLVYAPGAARVATPPGPSSPDRLKSGEALLRFGGAANTITSPDGRFTLTLQDLDGNLVLYEYGKRALWASGIRNDANWMVNQPDGNEVSYRNDDFFTGWASNTFGQGRSTLVVQDDGNVVLYRDSDHKAVWSTGTCCHAEPPTQPPANSNVLPPGMALVRGGVTMTSPNGTYTLVLQNLDGNLVLYKNGTQALWATGPRVDSWFTNQTDGNLVIYRSEGGVAWASNTYGKGQGMLTLQNDGNLVLYRISDHAVLWATNTFGK